MSVRAKFTVMSVTSFPGGRVEVLMNPLYDTSIPEDQRFTLATPWGEFKMAVDNPVASEQLIPGKTFYLDLTEVPPAA